MVNDSVNLAALADLKIGVVPVINLEWIEDPHDRASRGYSTEAVTDDPAHALRPLHLPAVHPERASTSSACPVVSTSDPFIALDHTADESLVDPLQEPLPGHRFPISSR